MKISDLKLDDLNANKGTEKGRKAVEQSLAKYGAGRSVLVDRDGRVIAGNKTVTSAGSLDSDEVIVVPSDGTRLVVVQRTDLSLDDPKARSLAIADNRSSEIGLEWDTANLKRLDPIVDLKDFFSETELRKLKVIDETSDDNTPKPQLERSLELQEKWSTERGQVWEAGKHRIMCGDSTDATEVTRLMHGEKAWLMATDPPYGVGYGIESGPDSAKRFGAMTSDEKDGPALQQFLESVFTAAIPHLNSGAAWYLWHAQMTQGFFAAAAAAAAAAVRIHRQIIWAKSHFILGHGDFHWQHELCFYGWREGEKHRWFGDRSQTTLWKIDNPRAHENHPTEKPPEIFARSMRLSTEPGELCYEPFSGSGSQLCAAELSGRACYAMEIEPKYVAVALERLSEMGLVPKLVTE